MENENRERDNKRGKDQTRKGGKNAIWNEERWEEEREEEEIEVEIDEKRG